MEHKEFDALKEAVIAAMQNDGIRRMTSVGDVIERVELTEGQMVDLLVEVFFAGKRAGKEQLKKEIARM